MRTLPDVVAARRAAEATRREGRTLGFVPTMGFLHEGHLSLIRKARMSCDRVIVSIYVNPTQFGPGEDLDQYPRDLRRDSVLCLEERVDYLFVPTDEVMYPPGFSTKVSVAGVTESLCGAGRPGHFDGVATVVLKLLSILRPHHAFFGEKDYQQLVTIRRMATDLNLETRIVACPTVREPDGLAMSSRNVRLSPAARAAAPWIHQGLVAGADLIRGGETDPEKVLQMVRTPMAENPPSRIEYLEIRDADDLEPVGTIAGRVVIAAAVHLGSVRLIDNVVVEREG